MKTAAVIQAVAGAAEGDDYTAIVVKVYDKIVAFGPDATDYESWEQITSANGDLALLPNADLSAAAARQIIAEMQPE